MITFCAIVVLLVGALSARYARRRRRQLPLPPGPPAEPIIGHMRLLPNVQIMAEVFHEWSQKYGTALV